MTTRGVELVDELDLSGDETLLDAGEAAGVLMPSGCRMGVCFGCVVPLRQGAVRDLRTGDVTSAAPGDNPSTAFFARAANSRTKCCASSRTSEPRACSGGMFSSITLIR